LSEAERQTKEKQKIKVDELNEIQINDDATSKDTQQKKTLANENHAEPWNV
jgi:hypothetical protein